MKILLFVVIVICTLSGLLDSCEARQIRRLQTWTEQVNGQCTSQQCYSAILRQCFHLTSYECQAAIAPKPASPTPQPVMPIVNKIHPIQLVISNVEDDYVLGSEVRSNILRYVSERLRDYLSEDFGQQLKLIKVEYAGRLKENQQGRHLSQQRQLLKSIFIPLKITVQGPADIQDYSLSYIMEIMRNKILIELLTYLRSANGSGALNGDGVVITLDTYDFDDILLGGMTNEPTRSPTSKKVDVDYVEETPETNEEPTSESSPNIAWWAWLIIVLVIIGVLVCLCLCCMSMIRSKNSENESARKQAQTIEDWMVTGSTVASSTTYNRRSQRQLNHEYYENQVTFLGQPLGVGDLKRDQYQKSRRHSSSRELHSENRNRRRSRPRHKMEHGNGKARNKRRRRSTQVTEYDDSIDSPRTLQLLDHQEEHALVPYVENPRPGNDGALVPYSARRSSEQYDSSKAFQLHSMYVGENHQDYNSSFNTRTTKDPDGKMDWEAYSDNKSKKKSSRKKREARGGKNEAKVGSQPTRPSKSTYQVRITRERPILEV